ncbi:MAG TPA: rhomboid family intramembrane serine protease [Leptospiraceae bacterium]|nr:rhomboid family intramembrane serine protease [Leptospiraceae bacterium]HNC01281.1 rhomboid family intramembrane serine protease [Leptospiraceae bacterium]HNE07541.1 rhomboid family intramembrane serine protease [Leptospiraceae bacterium]HNE52301.1 rhomboid family intramembrane serine protease [Leptospiraceae bacterium]HNG98741.1 rhomboid family intramembrane serine protease [Leptospiraceae bacterium]
MLIWKIFWEYPLTASMTLFLPLFYFVTLTSVPEPTLRAYFYSYPGKLSLVNWILASCFHSSLSHLISNMGFLYFLGRAVEAKVGKGKWLLFYGMAAIISMMADSIVRGYIIVDRNIPTVGASGAISGLAAIAALLSPVTYRVNGVSFPFPVFLVAWIMVYTDIMRAFSSDLIAHWAHLAGFFSVFITTYLLSPADQAKIRNGFLFNFTFFILTVILIYLLENR